MYMKMGCKNTILFYKKQMLCQDRGERVVVTGKWVSAY